MNHLKSFALFLATVLFVGCGPIDHVLKIETRESAWKAFEPTFETFRASLIKEQCGELANICSFPLTPSAVHLVSNQADTLPPGGVSRAILLENCALLDSFELSLLSSFEFSDQPQHTDHLGNTYLTSLYYNEQAHHFRFNLGCIHVKDDDLGEYSIIFQFDEIAGKWILNKIYIAG